MSDVRADAPRQDLISSVGARGFSVQGGSGRREVIYVALVAAEACWVTPVFWALTWVRTLHPPFLLWLGMLVVMLAHFYIYRAVLAAHLSLPLQQSLSVAGLLLGMALILRFHVYAGLGLQGIEYLLLPFRELTNLTSLAPSTGMTVIILVYLWARAVHLANRTLTAGSVGFSFRAGVVILIVAALLVKLIMKLDISGFVMPYFFFALVAVALSRVEEISLLPNSSRVPISGFWIGWTLAAVGILVLLSGGFAVLYGRGLRVALQWLSPVFNVLQIIFFGIAALLLMLLEWIFAQLSLDLNAIGQALREVLARLGQFLAEPIEVPPSGDVTPTRPPVFEIAQAVIAVAIPLSIVALVLFFTWHRLRRGGPEAQGEESRESLMSAKALAQNLQSMLQDGLGRLGELAGQVSRLGPGARFLAAVSIRRIYANLVRLAADAGYPRSEAQTPYEYLKVLTEAWPGSAADVTCITEAYVNAHYGEVPDSREELQRIRECWERLRRRDR